METMLYGLTTGEVEYLQKIGFSFTIVNETCVDCFSVYDIEMNGDEEYTDMAQDALYEEATRYVLI